MINRFKELFKAILYIPKSQAVICWFSDYHGFIPLLLSRLFNKRFIVIVGGYDAIAYKELNYDKAKNKAAVLLKQERVMKEVEKSVLDVAKDMGVDHEYIFRSLKQLAETSVDENIALQSLKEMGKAIGTLGGGVKRVESGVVGLFQGFTPEQIENVERKMIGERKE